MFRRLTILMLALLMFAACGGGTEDTGSGEAARGGGLATAGAGPDDLGFCAKAAEVAEVFDQADEFDPEESLALLEKLADEAPSEIADSFDLTVEWYRQVVAFMENGTEPTIDEAEVEAAAVELDRYFVDVCGIVDTEDDPPVDTENAVGDEDAVSVDFDPEAIGGRHVIVAGGETYEETVSGDMEAFCEFDADALYVYLWGSDFQSEAYSDSTGMEPGTYFAQVFVFPTDLALEDTVGQLSEVDGEVTVNEMTPLDAGQWLVSGGFNAAIQEPAASVEATFACVALEGF